MDRPTRVDGNLPDTGSLVFSQVTIMPNADVSQSYIRLVAAAPTLERYGLKIGGPSFRCSGEDYQMAPGVCVSAHMGTPG
jgi:hypothetical protein